MMADNYAISKAHQKSPAWKLKLGAELTHGAAGLSCHVMVAGMFISWTFITLRLWIHTKSSWAWRMR